MREDDCKIAEWLGWTKPHPKTELWVAPNGHLRFESEIPSYKTSDADAISLLPVMAQKTGEDYILLQRANGDAICYPVGGDCGLWTYEPAISTAITSAVLALIEMEGKQ